jgi:hypothetical protein
VRNANIPRCVGGSLILAPSCAARPHVASRPDRAVPVYWGTWWPVGLPQPADLIDLPAAAFAAQVVRIAPATSVHVLRSSSSVGRALLDMPWESVLGRQQRSRSPHEPKACAPRTPPPGDLSRPPVHVGRSMNTLNSVGSASDATGTSLTSLGVGFSRWARTTGCTMAKSEATQAGILDPPQRARNTATVSPNPRIERSQSWRKPRSASRSTGSASAAKPKKCGNFGRQARYRSCCGGGAPRGNERKQ